MDLRSDHLTWAKTTSFDDLYEQTRGDLVSEIRRTYTKASSRLEHACQASNGLVMHRCEYLIIDGTSMLTWRDLRCIRDEEQTSCILLRTDNAPEPPTPVPGIVLETDFQQLLPTGELRDDGSWTIDARAFLSAVVAGGKAITDWSYDGKDMSGAGRTGLIVESCLQSLWSLEPVGGEVVARRRNPPHEVDDASDDVMDIDVRIASDGFVADPSGGMRADLVKLDRLTSSDERFDSLLASYDYVGRAELTWDRRSNSPKHFRLEGRGRIRLRATGSVVYWFGVLVDNAAYELELSGSHVLDVVVVADDG